MERKRIQKVFVGTERSLFARTSLAARSRAGDNTPIAGIVAPERRDHAHNHTHNYRTRITPQIWTP